VRDNPKQRVDDYSKRILNLLAMGGCAPSHFHVEKCPILEDLNRRLCWQDDVENTPWLDLLRSFVTVKNLYLSKEFVPYIAPTPRERWRKDDRSFAQPGEYFLKGFSGLQDAATPP
jgi:hypothetical protein